MDYFRSTFTSLMFLLHFIFQIVQGLDLPNVLPRTCIIGAGYSGLSTAKHLKEYNMDFTVFEASRYLGGVWHFDPRVGADEDGIPIFSKTYKNLRINTPYQFTELNYFPFPEGISSFPSWECMNKYFVSLATTFELLQHIQFRRLVTSVKRFGDQWQLTYWRGDTREAVTEACDYIVIATGVYNDPVWPVIQGAETFQGTISHSHTYRGDTEVYRNRRVLVLGAGASGLDIAAQISRVASKLFHSHHRILNLPIHEESYVKKPDIKTFTPNGVIFNDGSFEEVDDVIYCTGYKNLYSQGNYAASLIAGRFQLPSEDEMMKSWVNEVNHIQDIEEFTSIKSDMGNYCGNLSQEASIPTILPVYSSMVKFHVVNYDNDFVHSKDYEWHIIDDHNFDRVYVGPMELTCPIV